MEVFSTEAQEVQQRSLGSAATRPRRLRAAPPGGAALPQNFQIVATPQTFLGLQTCL